MKMMGLPSGSLELGRKERREPAGSGPSDEVLPFRPTPKPGILTTAPGAAGSKVSCTATRAEDQVPRGVLVIPDCHPFFLFL